MEDVRDLQLLKYKLSSWLFALDLKLNKIEVSLGSIETALQALSVSHAPSSSVILSLQQVYQYLDSQHQLVIEETSDMTAIEDNLNSETPFKDTDNFHVAMLMSR
jgi:hypothetical protein